MSSLKDYLAGRSVPTTIDNDQKLYGVLNDESVAITAGLIAENTQIKVYNEQTASNYDFVLSDANNVIDRNVATANTVTIPPNSSVAYPLGTWLWVNAIDEITSWVAGSGVTITSSSGNLNCIGQLLPTGARKIGTNSWHLYNGKSLTQIRSDLFIDIPYVTGSTRNRYYGTGEITATVTTAGVAANTMYAWPFIVRKEITIDTILAEVTTGQGTSKVRIGIYNDNGTCYPGDLIYGSAELSGASNAVISETIGSPVVVYPGLNWVVVLSDGTPAFRAWATGCPVILGLDSTALGNQPSRGLSVSKAYAALPSTFDSGAAPTAAATNAHMVLVRIV